MRSLEYYNTDRCGLQENIFNLPIARKKVTKFLGYQESIINLLLSKTRSIVKLNEHVTFHSARAFLFLAEHDGNDRRLSYFI